MKLHSVGVAAYVLTVKGWLLPSPARSYMKGLAEGESVSTNTVCSRDGVVGQRKSIRVVKVIV